jgi:hypothetical protein
MNFSSIFLSSVSAMLAFSGHPYTYLGVAARLHLALRGGYAAIPVVVPATFGGGSQATPLPKGVFAFFLKKK